MLTVKCMALAVYSTVSVPRRKLDMADETIAWKTTMLKDHFCNLHLKDDTVRSKEGYV